MPGQADEERPVVAVVSGPPGLGGKWPISNNNTIPKVGASMRTQSQKREKIGAGKFSVH